MRLKFIAASVACLSLAACGGWKSGQANNAQANISQDSRPPATANSSAVTNGTGSNGMVMLDAPLSKDRALAVMHERHEGMEGLGKATKAIGRELKSSSPNLGAIRASAKAITSFAPKVASLFPAGTGPDVGKTRAKPDIWQNRQDFAAKAGDLHKAAQAFGAAVQGSDVNAINSSFANLGKTCKACHDKYRAEEQH